MLYDIHIINWKGHEELSLQFNKGVNFITGPNGIGKTSILDAICYVFLGTLDYNGSYRGVNPTDLVRNVEKESEIDLTFAISAEGQRYEIMRRISPNRRAWLKADGVTIATNWQDVTDKILELFNASSIFLGRYVFLSEGETYEYINKPPGEGLAKHIESVLGIDSMEDLESLFGGLYKKYSSIARDLRKQISGAQIASDQDMINYEDLNKRLIIYSNEQKSTSDVIERLNREYGVLSSEVTLQKKSQIQIDEIINDWQKNFAPFTASSDPIQVLKEKRNHLEIELKNYAEKRNQLATQGGGFSALIESAKSVIQLVHRLPNNDDRSCPICKRPLSSHMVEEIEKESQETIEKLQINLSEQKKQATVNERNLEDVRKKLDMLGALELKVNNILKYGPGTLSTDEINKKVINLDQKVNSVLTQIAQLKQTRHILEVQLLELKSKIAQLSEKIEPSKINTMNKSLITATKVEFLSQIFLTSVEDSLTKQRSVMIAPLMKELSTMWSSFMNNPIEVEMGEKCELNIIDKRYHLPFKFPQLSGGEKTALLILTHILLCKNFSDVDFMLLDEPLEHLDSRNRWSLVNFLIQSCTRGVPEQLIITTIEEPFIREYMDNPIVKVTKLG
jgi:exonuclease SbcC